MNKLWNESLNDSKEKKLLLTYPWISVELVPWKNNFYEIVWNCGGLWVLVSSLSNEKTKVEATKTITKIFESLRETNDKIIFVTDQNIINYNQEIFSIILENIFWKWNFAIVWIWKTSTEKNPVSWLQINRSGFTDEDFLVKTIEVLPDATVLSSIPFSDPRVCSVNKKLKEKNINGTVAAKTLQLLDLNSKKSNQLKINWVSIMTNFLAIAKNPEELEDIFNKNSEKRLVLKDDNWAAWWTSVNFAGTKEQQNAILKLLKEESFPQVVFEFIEPTVAVAKNWDKHPLQFRPFLNHKWEFMWWALKLPSEKLNENLFQNGAWKWTFDRQNKSLNSSSWKTHSLFLNEKWELIIWFISWNWYNILNAKETKEFLENFVLPSGKVLSGENILEISEPTFWEVRRIQSETNRILDI